MRIKESLPLRITLKNFRERFSHTVDDPRTGKLSPRVVRYYITPQLACEGHLTHSKFLQDFQKQGDFYGFLTDFLEKRRNIWE